MLAVLCGVCADRLRAVTRIACSKINIEFNANSENVDRFVHMSQCSDEISLILGGSRQTGCWSVHELHNTALPHLHSHSHSHFLGYF